jgi:hypothetical protein
MKKAKSKSRPKNPLGNRLAHVNKLFPGVKRVVDSRTSLEVHVGEVDCKSAQPNEPDDCALARAVKREYKADGVIIGIGGSYIIRGDRAIRFQTTGSVGREITSFDRHHDFAPGVYRLSKVSPSRRLGTRPGHRKGDHHSKEKNQRVLKTHRTVRVRSIYK